MTALEAPHECPAAGCGELIDAGEFACSPHWRMVPRFTQRRLTEVWRLGWAEVAGRARPIDWWRDRAVREINAAVANRERQLAAQRVGA